MFAGIQVSKTAEAWRDIRNGCSKTLVVVRDIRDDSYGGATQNSAQLFRLARPKGQSAQVRALEI